MDVDLDIHHVQQPSGPITDNPVTLSVGDCWQYECGQERTIKRMHDDTRDTHHPDDE